MPGHCRGTLIENASIARDPGDDILVDAWAELDSSDGRARRTAEAIHRFVERTVPAREVIVAVEDGLADELDGASPGRVKSPDTPLGGSAPDETPESGLIARAQGWCI